VEDAVLAGSPQPPTAAPCVERMRDVIVANGGDAGWMDTKKWSAGEVAQEWLRLRSRV